MPELMGTSAVKLLSKEINDIMKGINASMLEGIELIPNEVDIMTLHAYIIGPEESPFKNGRFKIKLLFNESYPHKPPKGYFLTKIFHPNIAPSTGEICLNTLQRDWRPDLGLAHLLLTIRCLLADPNPESALNEEAAKFLLENHDKFVEEAIKCTLMYAPSISPLSLPSSSIIANTDKNKKDDEENKKRTNSDEMLQNNNTKPSSLSELKKKLKRL